MDSGTPMGDWRRVAFAMFAVGWGANQFSPLLLAYKLELGMSAQTRAFLFGVYVVGLIPALLLGGGASDRWGRRAVVVPAVALSPLATVLLIAFHDSVPGLAVARLLAGVCSGVCFSAGSAWVVELSADQPAGTGSRRAAISLSSGFGLGPMLAAFIAQATPDKLTVPYLPHLVVGVIAAVLLAPMPDSGVRAENPRPLLSLPAVTLGRRFLLAVVPVAPWVFGCAALSFAYLPAELPGAQSGALAFAGVLTGLTLAAGVGIQPVARRLDDRRPLLAGQLGLLATILGTAIGVVTLTSGDRYLLLVAALAFGVGYGCCLVSGLRETERLSPADQRGATTAVFYALTYLGFAAPYVLGGIKGAGAGDRGALIITILAALASLAVVTGATRVRPGRRPPTTVG